MYVTKSNLRIYLAVKKADERSSMEDTLVLDGFNVSTFSSAQDLWESFQERQARMVITDRRFGTDFDGLKLAKLIRKQFQLPYVFIAMLSTGNRMPDIDQGLAAGVDDYLAKPHNPAQIRTRVLVGMRWLRYIDSLFVKDMAKDKSTET